MSNILIADNRQSFLNVAEQILLEQGHKVTIRCGRSDALDLLSGAGMYDVLIFGDTVLTSEVLEHIRRSTHYRYTPIIYQSVFDSGEVQQKMGMGVAALKDKVNVHYIHRDSLVASLASRVEEVVARK